MASEPSEAAQQPMDAAPVALSSPEAAVGLSKLRRFLAAHRGHFALALVRASQEDVKDELFGWTKSFCDAEKLKCIRIDQASEDDEAFFGRIAGLAQADTVYLLTGMDRAINAGADGQLSRLPQPATGTVGGMDARAGSIGPGRSRDGPVSGGGSGFGRLACGGIRV